MKLSVDPTRNKEGLVLGRSEEQHIFSESQIVIFTSSFVAASLCVPVLVTMSVTPKGSNVSKY